MNGSFLKNHRFISLIFILSGVLSEMQAQFREGEIIVALDQAYSAEAIIKNLGWTSNRSSTNPVTTLSQYPLKTIKLKTDEDGLELVLDKLNKMSGVLYAQRNKIIQYRKTPNDPLFKDQWQYNNLVQPGSDLNILSAWDITTGGVTARGDTIVVAVLEDGIGRHDDIVDNMWINRGEIPGDKIDNDGNGYVDDYLGWNVETNSDQVNIDDRHGTQVAGIIGASGNNGKGVSGINWKVKIMPIITGDIDEANAIAAYSYAYTQRKLFNESNGKKGAFIVATNSSWGIDRGRPEDAPLWCAFYDSLGAVGILSCAATINANVDVDIEGDLPTACLSDFLVTVTNVNRTDSLVRGAGYGKKSIDLGAFGENTYNITNNNRYTTFTGTSAATPHVTGAIALAYSVGCDRLISLAKSNPSEAARVLKQALLTSSKSNYTLQNISRAQGRLDIGNFISMVNSWCGACSTPLVNDLAEPTEEGQVTIQLPNQTNGGSVDLRMRVVGTSDWTEYKGLKATTAISNLNLCTEYEYQLKYMCGNTVLNDYKYSRFITSYGCCPLPKVSTTNYEDGVFVLNLEEQNLIQTSLLEYKQKDEVTWKNLNGDYHFEIKDLPTCSYYEFRVSHSCLDGKSQSPLTNHQSFHTTCGSCTDEAYCDNFKLNNQQEWISTITLGETLWETGPDNNGHGIYLGYKIPVLDKNKYYKLEIIPGFAAQSYKENFKVYVDLNNDQNFTAEDLLYTSNGREPFVKDSLLIPANVTPGIKRMRVVMNFEDRALTCNTSQDYGEVEEYCIEVSQVVGSENLELKSKIYLENTIFNDQITLGLDNFDGKNLLLNLYDASGRLSRQSLLPVEGLSSVQLSGLGELTSGLYFLQVISPELTSQIGFKLYKSP